MSKNKDCGPGNQKQRRDCRNGGTKKCQNSDTERTIRCNLPDCEKDFGAWKNESVCEPKQSDMTCGEGFQKQIRDCKDGTIDKCTEADRKRRNQCFLRLF